MSLTHSGTAGADVHGPVFISYRQSDGTEIAARVARRLRAVGVPVWRDVHDLPPGDTAVRLQEAIARGISGAVVVMTDEVANSSVMRTIEVPKLLELHRSDGRFALQIISDVWSGEEPDYAAPDRLLGLSAGTLLGVDQQPNSDNGLSVLVRARAALRVALHRDAGLVQDFALSIQSRNEGRATDVTDALLDLRFETGESGRLPSALALEDLHFVSQLLPTLFVESRAISAQISGGAHLSIAFAIAASLPSTRVRSLRARHNEDGPMWIGAGGAPAVAGTYEVTEARRIGNPVSPECAVYVDVVTAAASGAAFDNYWDANQSRIHEALIVTPAVRREITAAEGPALAEHINSLMRALWGRVGNGQIHLFLRVPFPLAIFLGRLSNTLPITLYEWSSSGGPHYEESLHVESGAQPVPCASGP